MTRSWTPDPKSGSTDSRTWWRLSALRWIAAFAERSMVAGVTYYFIAAGDTRSVSLVMVAAAMGRLVRVPVAAGLDLRASRATVAVSLSFFATLTCSSLICSQVGPLWAAIGLVLASFALLHPVLSKLAFFRLSNCASELLRRNIYYRSGRTVALMAAPALGAAVTSWCGPRALAVVGTLIVLCVSIVMWRIMDPDARGELYRSPGRSVGAKSALRGAGVVWILVAALPVSFLHASQEFAAVGLFEATGGERMWLRYVVLLMVGAVLLPIVLLKAKNHSPHPTKAVLASAVNALLFGLICRVGSWWILIIAMGITFAYQRSCMVAYLKAAVPRERATIVESGFDMMGSLGSVFAPLVWGPTVIDNGPSAAATIAAVQVVSFLGLTAMSSLVFRRRRIRTTGLT